MRGFELKDLLQAVGPTASLIFAAWIFLYLLLQRYIASYERYRSLIDEFRQQVSEEKQDNQDERSRNLPEQILQFKERGEKMRLATNVGVGSAITLISGLICAALGTMVQGVALFKYLTAFCAVTGLALVICAASLVIAENSKVQRIMDSRVADLRDLKDS
jgi:hypothetical protein